MLPAGSLQIKHYYDDHTGQAHLNSLLEEVKSRKLPLQF